MKIGHSIAGFLLGVAICAGSATFAQKLVDPPNGRRAPQWVEGAVDSGAIRASVSVEVEGRVWSYLNAKESFALERTDEGMTALRAKFDAEIKKQKETFLSNGFEPYAASAYAGQIYNNEQIIFFRKKLD